MADLRRPPHRPHPVRSGDDEPLVDPGRSLGLRLLALLGAFSVLMIGLSSLVPLLRSPTPPSMPGQRDGRIARAAGPSAWPGFQPVVMTTY